MAAAALAAAAGVCVLAGWLGALFWRVPADRRACAELELLRERVDGEVRQAADRAALERTRAGLAEAAQRQAELRAAVAEDETAELRRQLEPYERTPCAVCGLRLPACPHGREERQDWLEAHGGGFGVARGRVGGPRLPGGMIPGAAEVRGEKCSPTHSDGE